ncbi:hypothetical protein LguiB_032302 [Lonicera macranthoides]
MASQLRPSSEAVVIDYTTSIERSITNENVLMPPDKVTIKAVVTGKFNQNQRDESDSIITKLTLEIVAAELYSRTGLEKKTVKKEAKGIRDGDDVKFEATFEVPLDFGEIGAVMSYLPSKTPSGVRWLREKELLILQGDDGGERKKFESYPMKDVVMSPDDESSTRAFRSMFRSIKGENYSTVNAKVTMNLTSPFSDTIDDWIGKTPKLEIVPAELDPKSGEEKKRVEGSLRDSSGWNEAIYEYEFEVPSDFGEIGAVLVQNDHRHEMFLKTIILKRLRKDNSYLPSQTPSGLKKLREKELENLRGDGEGVRQTHDRIYDYDVYNDLGDPDKDPDLKRPVLGGEEKPYPRRCRTGRRKCTKDSSSESRATSLHDIYVPRDEAFSQVKSMSFRAKTILAFVHGLLPSLETMLTDHEFRYFTAIDKLFNEGIHLPIQSKQTLKNLPLRIIKAIEDTGKCLLRFETPQMTSRDHFSWIRDEEFCRQTLAGLNPYSIQLVTEWPLKSKLDPEEYGPPQSEITKELVEQQINGVMTLEEAIKQKKLFIIDYHDLLLPYVKCVRDIEGTTLYGSRTLMFLNQSEQLLPVAIELTRPQADKQPQWKKVFTPSSDATGAWLWKMAKAHVLAHDSGYHQLVSHWLRTHCVTEPYIIATNRQLSAMHPIHRLLRPYFHYTMEINALARLALINADGVIESSFSPRKYSMELSSVAYEQWQFDLQALPADLISRGMAVEDPNAPHGLKLAIEDYPFAADSLILWDAIKQWVTDYVNYYYADASLVKSDEELQGWWNEIQTVGHKDKKDEPWWPVLNTPEDLIGILTTIIWVTSGHHSAVNFGQYDFAGYFPNRPSIARTKMPNEDPTDQEWTRFLNKPEDSFLSCLPSPTQAVKVMGILDLLSTHSADEEYIGQVIEPSWEENQTIKASFNIFKAKLVELNVIIDRRNANETLKNRTGAGVVPYNLLIPVSEEGVTGQGVPNSISI